MTQPKNQPEEQQVFRCTFDRIGRNHAVQPQILQARDAKHLAAQVHQIARGHLSSREVDVMVDLDDMCGFIFVGGFRNAGQFAIEELVSSSVVVR